MMSFYLVERLRSAAMTEPLYFLTVLTVLVILLVVATVNTVTKRRKAKRSAED